MVTKVSNYGSAGEVLVLQLYIGPGGQADQKRADML